MKICLISTAPAEQWQINHLYFSDCYMTVEGVTPIVVMFNHTHKWRLQWKLQRQLGRTLQAPVGIDCGMMVFNVSDDKQRCICNMQLLLQLMRPLRAPKRAPHPYLGLEVPYFGSFPFAARRNSDSLESLIRAPPPSYVTLLSSS